MPGATLDMEAHTDAQTTMMGGQIRLSAGEAASIIVTRSSTDPGGQIVLVSDGALVGEPQVVRTSPTGGDLSLAVSVVLKPGATHGYVRPEVRDATGKLFLLGNPIYLQAK